MQKNLSIQPADTKPFGLRDVALGTLLLLLLLLFYSPAIRGAMVFDDDRLITMEDLRSLHGLWRIWFSPPPLFSYYPLLHTVMWVEHRLWGDSVVFYHLMNIFQHAVAAWLVVAVMRRLALPGPWVAAFLFALHPVNVETVAWISEQKNTLSTVFFLASALAWLYFDGNRRKRWYLLASAIFLLAMLCKTTAATLPAALLVILWWRKGRLDWKRDVLPLVPWFAAGVGFGVLSGWIERQGYDTRSSDFLLSFPQHCLLASCEVWFYADKLLWPFNLMFNYPRWQLSAAEWWQWLFLLGLVGVAAGLCLLARWNRGPLAAFLFFVGNLFPVMGFLYVDWFMFSFVADHFQYVACLGIIVPLASGLALAAGKARPAAVRWPVRVAMALIFFVLSSLTWSQSHWYTDMEALYKRTVESNPESGMAHYNYGLVLLKLPGHLTEAMEEMEEALRLRPDDLKLQDRIGYIFMTTPGRLQEAADTFEHSLKIDPNDSYAHYLLGSTLAGMPGRSQEAIPHLEKAVSLKPDVAEQHYALGNALTMAPGRMQDAVAQYKEALRLDPDAAETHFMLGNALLSLPGRAQDAVAQYEEALRLKPDSAEAHCMLGNALSVIPGRTQEAVVQYEETLRLKPDMDYARERLKQLRSGK